MCGLESSRIAREGDRASSIRHMEHPGYSMGLERTGFCTCVTKARLPPQVRVLTFKKNDKPAQIYISCFVYNTVYFSLLQIKFKSH
jgi:hypothetical protein